MKKFLLVILSLMMSMSIFAAEAPDVFVKKIADEIFEILKTDKDLKAGNREKAYKITEEKILPYFDFDRISRLVLGKAYPAATKEEQEAFKKNSRNGSNNSEKNIPASKLKSGQKMKPASACNR